MLGLLKESEVTLAAWTRKPTFQNGGFFSFATAKSGKPLLKELQYAASKQNPLEKKVAKLVF